MDSTTWLHWFLPLIDICNYAVVESWPLSQSQSFTERSREKLFRVGDVLFSNCNGESDFWNLQNPFKTSGLLCCIEGFGL